MGRNSGRSTSSLIGTNTVLPFCYGISNVNDDLHGYWYTGFSTSLDTTRLCNNPMLPA